MGFRGQISLLSDITHKNIDSDVILAEEPTDYGSTSKPEELYEIIERFCSGKRRIELFGLDRNLRNGWVTVGNDLKLNNFDVEEYEVSVRMGEKRCGGLKIDSKLSMENVV